MSRFDGIIEVAHDLAADLRRLADDPNPENQRNAAESLAAFRAAGEEVAAEILPLEARQCS
jgi:hypothetical protein